MGRARIIFNEGDYVDPNKNFIYLREAGKRITPSGCHKRLVRVRDIRNNEEFDCVLYDLMNGHTQNSPERARMQRRVNNQKYKVGDIIEVDGHRFLFEKEVEELRHYANNGNSYRGGIFRDLDTQEEFRCLVQSVSSGEIIQHNYFKGEEKIKNILNEMGIKFYKNYSFDDLKSPKNYPLRIDFYLPEYNCCIEYDGEGHFEPRFNVTQEVFEYNVCLDKIKDDYCVKNGIKMIRVPYTDYNIIDSTYIINKIQ